MFGIFKINWFGRSLIVGLIISLLLYYYTNNVLLSFIGGGVCVAVFWIYHPKRRYIRLVYTLLTMLIVLNNYFVELYGNVSGINFMLGKKTIDPLVSISIVILTIIALILDYLERRKKGKIVFFKWKSNNTQINGDNNKVNQS